MSVLSYETYLDKIYGCFIGKAVSGNIGAPHEGVKMPMDFSFRPDMIDCSRPNDDLDLQILWLDVAGRYGARFTSYDLLERFVTHCAYNPGEYALMRKNFHRGVYPPYSGSFDNDYFRLGMGCPIRSEIWACLAAGNPALAADFASRDGILDHAGDSVEAERFLAALEAQAFFCNDVRTLIQKALPYIDADTRFFRLLTDTVTWCDRYGDSKLVLTEILASYGHPDCTNLYQNLGITLMALLLGEGDILKSSLLALNGGHDTDCTCATAGAILGIMRGADELTAAYGLTEVTYKLGVESPRQSDKIRDLAKDIAALGIAFTATCNDKLTVEGAPEVSFAFEEKPAVTVTANYPADPTIEPGGEAFVTLTFTNTLARAVDLSCTVDAPTGLISSLPSFAVSIGAHDTQRVALRFILPKDTLYISETNIVEVTATDEKTKDVTKASFGLVGVRPWKVCGPFWRTSPACSTAMLLPHFSQKYPYEAVIDKAYRDGHPGFTGSMIDFKREFHLNRALDTDTAFIDEASIFTAVDVPKAFVDHIEKTAYTGQCRLPLSAAFGMQGPCVLYYALIVNVPEDLSVGMQISYNSPFSLSVNGTVVAERKDFNYYTSENVHLDRVPLKAGDNRLVLRCVKKEETDCVGLIFSKGVCMSEHYVSFRYKTPTNGRQRGRIV